MLEAADPQGKAMEEWEETLDAMPMRTLLKREIYMRLPAVDKVKVQMMEQKFSMLVIPLHKDTAMSGEGEQQGFICTIYYEPANEKRVLNCFKKAGLDLAKKECKPLDPDNCNDEEWYFIYSEGEMMYISDVEYALVAEGDEDPAAIETSRNPASDPFSTS